MCCGSPVNTIRRLFVVDVSRRARYGWFMSKRIIHWVKAGKFGAVCGTRGMSLVAAYTREEVTCERCKAALVGVKNFTSAVTRPEGGPR